MTEIAPQHRLAVAAGADCCRCPLYDTHNGPVPPTLPAGGRIPFLVVAEAPGPIEVAEGRTLIGPSGREVRQALDAAGMDSNCVSYTNAMLCRPPGGDLGDYLKECKREGKPSPLECCNGRLRNELATADFTLFVGGASVRAAGVGESILKLRGTPLEYGARVGLGQELRLTAGLATLHPAFVLRDNGKLMRPVFRFDVAKAVRLARGGNTWRDPDYRVTANPIALAHFLEMLGPTVAVDTETVAVDTETDGIDPWTCRVRRVGLCDGKHNIIFAPLSVDGSWAMSDAHREACWNQLRAFFSQPRHWLFHNYYAFDAIVLGQHGVPVNERNLFDSLIGHHIGQTSEYPHGLDFLGSVYTDAPRWKDDVKHSATKSDGVLDRYLSFDTAVTWIAGQHVQAQVKACGQGAIYQTDASLARVGREMSRLGIRIDSGARIGFAVEYTAKANRLREAFLQAAGREVNPGSPLQLRKLLYEDFGLPVLEDYRTETDEPSTGEPALLALLALGVDDRCRRLIQALLGWREADKILGTFIGRIVDGKLEGGPRIHPDGRLRTTWKVHGTTSGRWSSGDPMNLQNIPKKLRAMFVPAPGNVFVAADYSALEARIIALLAGDAGLIEAFRRFDAKEGPDIHVVNAATCFLTTVDKILELKERDKDGFDNVRTFAKRFVYALNYGAEPEKIFETLSLARNDNLEPVFPGVTLEQVRKVFAAYWKAHPALLSWRKALLAGWRKHGYIATPWHGRRRYFAAGENPTEMYNHPIQGGAADLQNSAVLALVNAVPFGAGTGLVLQVHDQLVVETAAGGVENVSAALRSAMQRTVGPVYFPAEVKTGLNWKAVS